MFQRMADRMPIMALYTFVREFRTDFSGDRYFIDAPTTRQFFRISRKILFTQRKSHDKKSRKFFPIARGRLPTKSRILETNQAFSPHIFYAKKKNVRLLTYDTTFGETIVKLLEIDNRKHNTNPRNVVKQKCCVQRTRRSDRLYCSEGKSIECGDFYSQL